MGAGSLGSIRKVAALGDSLLLDQFASVEEIGERIAVFRREVEARGGVFDPMTVGVTRSINVTATEDDLERAMQARIAGRRRIDKLANRPDGPSARDISDAELRASALYGPPDAIAAKIQALRDVGVEYLLVNSAGGIISLRRFAQEIMPAFSGSPVLDAVD
jgi:alkanesulfonate monooxygenase SsuD/methylene tetrahydromethanopterin reductase-like flavin-dependent oxidoreductase (luciferase family)